MGLSVICYSQIPTRPSFGCYCARAKGRVPDLKTLISRWNLTSVLNVWLHSWLPIQRRRYAVKTLISRWTERLVAQLATDSAPTLRGIEAHCSFGLAPTPKNSMHWSKVQLGRVSYLPTWRCPSVHVHVMVKYRTWFEHYLSLCSLRLR